MKNPKHFIVLCFCMGSIIPDANAEKISKKLNESGIHTRDGSFAENKGQVRGFDGSLHPEVKYLLKDGNTKVFLMESGIAYQFTNIYYPDGFMGSIRRKGGSHENALVDSERRKIRTETYRMDMTLIGADPNARVTTAERSRDYINYPGFGVNKVYSYGKVIYHEIYPGIDWIVYTNGSKVKY